MYQRDEVGGYVIHTKPNMPEEPSSYPSTYPTEDEEESDFSDDFRMEVYLDQQIDTVVEDMVAKGFDDEEIRSQLCEGGVECEEMCKIYNLDTRLYCLWRLVRVDETHPMFGRTHDEVRHLYGLGVTRYWHHYNKAGRNDWGLLSRLAARFKLQQ